MNNREIGARLNDMLTVVWGNVSLARQGTCIAEHLEEAEKGCERAALIVRQLFEKADSGLDRLRNAMNIISENEQTKAEIMPLLESFIASIEEVADDLKKTSDIVVAGDLRRIRTILSQNP